MKIALFTILLLIGIQVCQADNVIHFGFVGAENNDVVLTLGKNMLHELASRIDMKYTLTTLPGRRAIFQMQRGRIQAELARHSSYKKILPDSIQVQEPIISVPYFAYSNTLTVLEGKGWDRLKPYRIVIVRGTAVIDENLLGFNTHNVNSMHTALKFMDMGRADIVVGPRLIVEPILKSMKQLKSPIKAVIPAIENLHFYTFFSSKYPDVAKEYHNALVEMKRDGTYQKIISSW